MTKLHDIGYYEDNHIMVPYCRKCSAEGDKLFEDCPQFVITDDHKRMAAYLNLSPTMFSSWPMDIINKLIWIEKEKGKQGLFEEIRKLISNFA